MASRGASHPQVPCGEARPAQQPKITAVCSIPNKFLDHMAQKHAESQVLRIGLPTRREHQSQEMSSNGLGTVVTQNLRFFLFPPEH